MFGGIRFHPHELIVPVFAADEQFRRRHFLGTGALVGQQPILVTAEHVVNAWSGPYVVAVPVWRPEGKWLFNAKLIKKDKDADLALLEVVDYPDLLGIQLAEDNEILHNVGIACFEYSTFPLQGLEHDLLGMEFQFRPATRIGNVTRYLDLSDEFGKAGIEMLELSFPALRGASGAPVVFTGYEVMRLWGIIKANVSRELLPAQVLTYVDEENQISEETRFYLPQAVAIHVMHLRTMLQEQGC